MTIMLDTQEETSAAERRGDTPPSESPQQPRRVPRVVAAIGVAALATAGAVALVIAGSDGDDVPVQTDVPVLDIETERPPSGSPFDVQINPGVIGETEPVPSGSTFDS